MKPGEKPGAARNFSTSAGIHQQHANLLRDQPTHIIHQVKTVDELDAALRERFGAKWDAIDSDAEEVAVPAGSPPQLGAGETRTGGMGRGRK